MKYRISESERFSDWKNLSFGNLISYTCFAKRLNPKKKAKVDVKGPPENVTIKDIDWKLLNILKRNSKMQIIDIAKELNLTAKAVVRRIDLLKKKGIIMRFYPWLNPKKLGYDEYTFIARIDPAYSKEIDDFMEFTQSDPRFMMAMKAVGYINLSYSFIVENDEELKELMRKIEDILGKGRLQSFKIEINDLKG